MPVDIRSFGWKTTKAVQAIPTLRQFTARVVVSCTRIGSFSAGQKYLNSEYLGVAEAKCGNADLAGCSRLYFALHPGTSSHAMLELWGDKVKYHPGPSGKRKEKGKIDKAAALASWAQELREQVTNKWAAEDAKLINLFEGSDLMEVISPRAVSVMLLCPQQRCAGSSQTALANKVQNPR